MLLSGAIEDTSEKLNTLKRAEKQVQEQFAKGEISQQAYNGLQREIASTEISLRDLEDAAKDVNDAINNAGKNNSNFGDFLKASAITEGAKAIVSSLKDVAEESTEYMRIMGSLETSSQAAGYSAEETSQIYEKLYGVLGDTQTAATTTANLQALGLSQDELVKATEAAIGAWSTYGDSIPIDGLAEAINETAKTGTVTGVLADALNWAGVSEDAFNEKLATTGDATERANMILQQLTSQGLVESGQAWQENNAALVEHNQAEADLQEQLAGLAEMAMPLFTQITSGIASLLGWFNSLDSGAQILIVGIIAITAAVGALTPAITSLGTAMNFVASNPIVLLIAAIVALVALIATKGDEIQAILQKVNDFLQGVFTADWTEQFGILGNILNAFFANLKNIWDAVMQVFNGIIDFVRGVFTGDWSRAWNGIKEIFSGVFDGLLAIAKAPINGIIGILNGLIDGINWVISGLNKIRFSIPDWVPGIGGRDFGINIGNIGKIPYLASGGILTQGNAIVGEAGPELLTISPRGAIVQPLTNNTTNNSVGGITVNVYGAPGQDVNDLAQAVADKIEAQVQQRGAVWA